LVNRNINKYFKKHQKVISCGVGVETIFETFLLTKMNPNIARTFAIAFLIFIVSLTAVCYLSKFF
jgi:hypothetical protein